MLLVVLYGCKTWSLPLREEHRLRMSGNRVIRRLFGPKKEEEAEGWRFYDEELHNLYISPNIVINHVKENEMGGAYIMHGRDDKYMYI
jgi:hypothetical protein